MADPQRDLAPIVEPAAPPLPPGAADAPLLGLAAAVVALVFVLALALLLWRRRTAPLRALRRLPRAADPVAAAGELDALLRRRGIALDEAARAELEHLRFAPPPADAQAVLARLCRDAEIALRAKR